MIGSDGTGVLFLLNIMDQRIIQIVYVYGNVWFVLPKQGFQWYRVERVTLLLSQLMRVIQASICNQISGLVSQ